MSIADEEWSFQYYIWHAGRLYLDGLPYAGSFRFSPVVDAFFAPGVEIYTLDLEVVGFDVSFERKPRHGFSRESTSGRRGAI